MALKQIYQVATKIQSSSPHGSSAHLKHTQDLSADLENHEIQFRHAKR